MKNHKELFEALLAGEILECAEGLGKTIFLSPDGFVQIEGHAGFPSKSLLYSDWEIRPKTININGFEVPEPVKTPLKYNTVYSIPSITQLEGRFFQRTWFNDNIDHYYLNSGLIHLTKEAAELHAKALLSFTEVIK